jgi:hypothetical protein
LFLATIPAYSDTIQINSESDFIEAIENPYLFENFSLYSSGFKGYSLSLKENGYIAVMSASRGLYSLQQNISTRCDYDILRISFTDSPTPVTAVGGYFWPTDYPGHNLTGQTKVKLSDGTEIVSANADYSDFLGFINTNGETFQFLEISVLSQHTWPTLDNLYVGSANESSSEDTSTILTPEPASLCLLASGILGIGIVLWRKRFHY